ncbi:MAG: TetR/AcrR family transcriptional regulator [Gaiellaceae bacterium]
MADSKQRAPGRRLGPDDWSAAALDAIADGGLTSVVIEKLARGLNTTKGSFYWHFADRAALIEAAVTLWERTRTEAIIEALKPIDDPRERLRELFILAFSNPQAGRIEAGLVAHTHNHVITEAVQRVSQRRIDYLAQLFAEIGLAPVEAQRRALVSYGTYLGLFVVRASNPQSVPLNVPVEDLAHYLVALLAGPRPPATM